jgi:LPS-assembly lipoprotein
MWWSEPASGARALIAAGIIALTAGCGFRPLYLSGGEASGEPTVGGELASVDIAPIRDRVGQLVRNDLLFLLSPTVDETTAAYRLDVRIAETISELAVERTGFATRSNLRLNATYSLIDLASGKPLVNGRTRAISSYNIVNASYSTLTAQYAARERAARQIAEDIRSRLSAYFAGRETTSATTPARTPSPSGR